MDIYSTTAMSTTSTSTPSVLATISPASNTANANDGVNISLYGQSVAKVNIYYEDLIYTEIVESPAMTPDTLIGAIGKQYI
jgi:hypothetical protein